MSDEPRPAGGGLELSALACGAGFRTLFEDVHLRLEPGQWAALTGPNGTGKSTLLRAVAGLTSPLRGEIRWRGRPRRAGSPAWRADCLYQGHAAGWKDSLSAEENLQLQAALDGVAPSRAALSEELARVGLTRQARLPFARLSAGQRRRLSLARLSLAHRPLWLLDEPGTALDTEGQQRLVELLDEHLALGGIAVVATHQPLTSAAAAVVCALQPWAPKR
ncbi:MAG: cytochrome c biogenesis heme-transporting ATPase CcmA [Burkholderiaceae bacterium]